MSNLGFQGIFYLFAKQPLFHVNRFFFDPLSNSIFSPENHFRLYSANLIFVSHSYESDFLNLVKMLTTSGINPYAHQRKDVFIGVGGAFPSINYQIYLPLADIIFKGDFEPYINTIINISALWYSCKDKIQFISLFIQIKPFIISKFITNEEHYKTTLKTKNNSPINSFTPNYSHIITNNTVFPYTFLIEITRGCRFKCSFCTVPETYGNLRYFPKETLFPLIDTGIAHANKIGLVSALTTDHKQLIQIINYINNFNAFVSFSSLRIENISEDLLRLMRFNKQNILTIAPEVASRKLARLIKKPFHRDVILDLCDKAISLGFKSLKLYFIIGFIEEDQDDINAIISLVKDIRNIALAHAKQSKFMTSIIVNINQFIPKPNTHLAYQAFIDETIIKTRINTIKKHLTPLGIIIRVNGYFEAFLQWKLAHADNNIGSFIIDGIAKGISTKSLFSQVKHTFIK